MCFLLKFKFNNKLIHEDIQINIKCAIAYSIKIIIIENEFQFF